MRKLILLLFIPLVSFGQEGLYYSDDGVLSIEMPSDIDILNGYPTADELNSDALDDYNKATELFYKLGNLTEDNEKIKLLNQAANYFIKAIKSDSKFVQAYDNLGKTYRMLNKNNLAIKSYKISLKIFPKGNSARQNLAIVYTEIGDWDKAIYEYKTLISLSSNNPEGYYGLANVYSKIKNYDLALPYALDALKLYKLSPTNYIGDSYGQVGLIYYYLGNKSEARKHIQTAKTKYVINGFESNFYSTFPQSLLNELNIK
jgi:tetratricopeptide (TPR) repeat protein